eukprot:TCONS_00039957-protein
MMSWFFGKTPSSSSQIPATTPLQQQRIKQIKSLSNHNQNVTEIKRDNIYKVTFLNSNSKTFALNIHLPPEFPNEKPYITLSPKSYHPWVDSTTDEIRGCVALNSFYMHSDLGKVVQQIIKEMKKTSPVIKKVDSPTSSLPYNKSPETNLTPPIFAMPKRIPQDTGDPDLDKLLGDLGEKSNSELEQICNDPDILIDQIESMESVKKLQTDRIKCIEENEAIAKSSLDLEPVIDDLKGDLKETFETYNELFYSCQDKIQRQNELSQFYETGNILTNLRISVMQSEEESENIAEDFLKGNLKLDDFLNNFIEKRKETHLRRVKEERIKCLVPY